MAKSVLPHPAAPQRREGRSAGNPPSVTSSRPLIPVGHLASACPAFLDSNLMITGHLFRLFIRPARLIRRRSLANAMPGGLLIIDRPSNCGLDIICQRAVIVICQAAGPLEQLCIQPECHRFFHVPGADRRMEERVCVDDRNTPEGRFRSARPSLSRRQIKTSGLRSVVYRRQKLSGVHGAG